MDQEAAAARDRDIVRRVLAGDTLQQAARAYGLTRQRVSQIMSARCPGWDGRVRRADQAAAAREARAAAKARRAAAARLDVITTGRPRRWTDAMILDALRAASANGTAPTVARWRDESRSPSVTIVIARYGSWNQACAAAGLAVNSPARNRSRIPDARITEAIAAFLLHPSPDGRTSRDRGGAKAYADWATANGLPSLSTVRARFGSWSTAKREAVAHLKRRGTVALSVPAPPSGSNDGNPQEDHRQEARRPQGHGQEDRRQEDRRAAPRTIADPPAAARVQIR